MDDLTIGGASPAALNDLEDLTVPDAPGASPVGQPLLARFHAALAAAWTTPVDVVILGDSISHPGASSWAGLASGWFARAFGGGVGAIWVPAQSMTTPGGTNSTAGFGGACKSLANGQAVVQTSTCTGFTLRYRSAPGRGTLSIVIDGGAPTVVDLDATAGTHAWSSSTLSSGSHTLTVTATVGGGETACIVEGVFVHDATNSASVRIWNASSAGRTTDDYLASDDLALDVITDIDPALVIIATGTNGTEADHADDLSDLIDTVQAACDGDVAIWNPYTSGACTSLVLTSGRDVADALGLAVIESQFTAAGLRRFFLHADGIHPSEQGAMALCVQACMALSGAPLDALAGWPVVSPGDFAVQTRLVFLSEELTPFVGLAGPGLGFAAPGAAVPTAYLTMPAPGIIDVAGLGTGAALKFREQTAPSAPAENQVMLYAQDNGAGKTQLMARFATGSAAQVAIEP